MPKNVHILITTRHKLDHLDCIEGKLFSREQANLFVENYLKEHKHHISFGDSIYDENEDDNKSFLPLNLLKLAAYAKHFNLKIGVNQIEVAGGPIKRILDDLFVNFEHDKSLITYIAYLDGRQIQIDLIQSLTNLSDNLLNESIARFKKICLIISDENEECASFRIHADLHSTMRQFVDERLEVEEKTQVYSNLINKFYGEMQTDLALDTVYDSNAIDKLRHMKKFLKIFKNFELKSDQVKCKEAQIHAYLAQLYENIFINHEYALNYYLKAVENFKKVNFGL